MIWVCSIRVLGRSKVLEYLPETWLLTNPKDLALISNLAISNPFHPILIKGNTITDNQTELPDGLPLFISELNKESHEIDSYYIENQLNHILPLMMSSIAAYTDQNQDSKIEMAQLLEIPK